MSEPKKSATERLKYPATLPGTQTISYTAETKAEVIGEITDKIATKYTDEEVDQRLGDNAGLKDEALGLVAKKLLWEQKGIPEPDALVSHLEVAANKAALDKKIADGKS